MFKMLSITLLIYMALIHFTSISSLDFEKSSFEKESLENLANKLLKNGRMDGFLDHEEYDDLVNYLSFNFPEIIEKFSIGITYENRNITAVRISSKEKHKNEKSAILFTGMHHAREPASMMMNLYLILYFIESYAKNITIVKELIHSADMYFIPILNIDGYIKNNKIYENYGNLEKCMQRKNSNRGSRTIFCSKDTDYGVDLNRNYGFKFNYDQEGASNHPCDEDYRGPSAFSEPETQAIRDFIESDSGKKIKIAFNYHSYGNILIMPFNFDDKDSKVLAMNYTQQYLVYNDFIDEGHFPDLFKYGNGKKTIDYKANGESADWMLGEKKIVAFSPELGNSNSGSDHFYPNIDLILREILPQNLISALYAIQRTGYYLRFFTLKNSYLECSIIQNYQHKFMDQNEDEKKELKICLENNHLYQLSNTIALKNTGFSDFRGKTKVIILINLNNVKYLSIKTDSGSNNNNKSNIKKRIFDKNITEVTQRLTEAEKSGNITDKSYIDIDDDNNNLVFKYNNTIYLLSEIEQENIDNQNFNLLDIKIYFDKEFINDYFAELDKIRQAKEKTAVSVKFNSNGNGQIYNKDYKDKKINHPENDTFKKLNLEDFLVSAFLENEFISISNNKLEEIPILNKHSEENNNHKNKEIENIIKNYRLYFANDNYKIKISEFELFEIKKKQTKEFSLIEGFFDLIIYSSLMFFLILSIVFCLYKIKMWCEKRKIKKQMDDLPNTARSASLNGKRYAELQTLENSIRRDSQQATGPKYDF